MYGWEGHLLHQSLEDHVQSIRGKIWKSHEIYASAVMYCSVALETHESLAEYVYGEEEEEEE